MIDFAVLVDHKLKKKKQKYREIHESCQRTKKKTVVYESTFVALGVGTFRKSFPKAWKEGLGEMEVSRRDQDHPDFSIVEIG